MIDISRKLKDLIDSARPRLLSMTETLASEKRDVARWSVKEILGHLIDSAANNHQRIVRMQESPNIGSFGYTQQHWVLVQRYQDESWADLINLWYSYNTHLSHIIRLIDADSLNHLCDVGYSAPATLRFVIEDYVRHVEHHLKHILGNPDPTQRDKWVPREPGTDH